MTNSPDWKKLYTAFDPFRPLPANDPAWVDCASVRGEEDILAGLGLEIQRSPKVTCQLYAGHRGAGKSTELRRMMGIWNRKIALNRFNLRSNAV
jgi:hypothetical protein